LRPPDEAAVHCVPKTTLSEHSQSRVFGAGVVAIDVTKVTGDIFGEFSLTTKGFIGV
jgi:hypothetical protein